MNNTDIAILIFSVSYSFVIVYLIDNGMQPKLQRYFLLGAVVALLLFILFIKASPFVYLNWGFLTLPVFIIVLYYLINLASWKVNGREFRLSIRGSRNQYRDNTNWSDKLFSFFLIISFFVWPVSLALLLKKWV